jgi:hypothetical protein
MTDAPTQPPPAPSKPAWAAESTWKAHAEPELLRWFEAERYGAVPAVLRPRKGTR